MPLDSAAHVRPSSQKQLVVIDLPLNTTSETLKSPEIALTNERQEFGLTEVIRENFFHETIRVVNNEGTSVGKPGDDV